MGLIRNNLSLRMKGRAGAYSFYSSNGRQIVRVSQNSTNYGESARRSPAQQRRRVMWANLVNFYKASASWMRGAFESKKSNETDYNAFMRKNLGLARIALTKDEASVGSCVADQYIVSEGSIPSVTKSYGNGVFETTLAISKDYTSGDLVSDFSNDVLDNNRELSEGMQISVIEFRQSVAGGYPRVSVAKYELTLSRSNTATLASYLGGMSIESDDDDFLTIDTGFGTNSGAALIISDSTGGKIRVSTEHVWGGWPTLIQTYTSQMQLEDAMESYGVDPTYFLESGSEQVTPEDPEQKILYAWVNGQRVADGGTLRIPAGDGLSSFTMVLAVEPNNPNTLSLLTSDDVCDVTEGKWVLEESEIIIAPEGIAEWDGFAGESAIPHGANVIVEGVRYTINWQVQRI